MTGLNWETTGTGIDYGCPGFDVRRDEVEFPDGTEGEYHYVDEPPTVVVLPFTPEGDVVVIEEWRQAVSRINRGIPAGGVEPDEETDLERAAARELAEETGYEAGDFRRLTTVEPSNGLANSVHHHYVATDCRPTAEQDLDDNESIRVDTVGYETLLAGVLDGDRRDGRTATAVMCYELTREGDPGAGR